MPALVLEMPAGRIVAVSRQAEEILNPASGPTVGRLLEEFTADRPRLGGGLFAGGELNGLETFRLVRRRSGRDVPVRIWIRRFSDQPASMYVLLVIAADDRSICRDDGGPVNRAPAVFGLADSALVIERISGDAELLFGVRVSEILGASLLRLVVAADADLCAEAAAEASRDSVGSR